MRRIADRFWKQVAAAVFLIGMDAAISLPIMGATYRPFSWMSIAPADAATLYPVIRNVSFADGQPTLSVEVSAGARVVLQRSTNLLDEAGWRDVTSATAADQVILLIDTNPVSRSVFYRVRQLLGESP